MKIESLKHIKHIQPSSSCGTGYSEPDLFEATDSEGNVYNFYIDTWYASGEDAIRDRITRAIIDFEKDNSCFKFHNIKVSNKDDIYYLWREAMINAELSRNIPDIVSEPLF